MNPHPYPTDLTYAEWELLERFDPPHPRPVDATASWICARWSMRSFLSSMGALHGGCSPMSIPSGRVCTGHFDSCATVETGNASMIRCAPRCAHKLGATSPQKLAVSPATPSRPRSSEGSAATRAVKRGKAATGLSSSAPYARAPPGRGRHDRLFSDPAGALCGRGAGQRSGSSGSTAPRVGNWWSG